MKHLCIIFLIITCALTSSCNSGSNGNPASNSISQSSSKTNSNNLRSSNGYKSSARDNMIPRTLLHFPVHHCSTLMHNAVNVLQVNMDGLMDYIGLGSTLVSAAPLAAVVGSDQAFLGYNAAGSLNLILRSSLKAAASETPFQGLITLAWGETIIDSASNENGNVILITQHNIYVVLVTRNPNGTWQARNPNRIPGGPQLTVPAPASLMSIDFSPSTNPARRNIFLATINDPRVPTGVRYFTSDNGGQTWVLTQDDGGPVYPPAGGPLGLRFLDPTHFASWRGDNPLSDMSSITICPIQNNTPGYKNIKDRLRCTTTDTTTDQNIVGAASNYLSFPDGSETPPLILAAGAGGDIIKTTDMGKTWTTTARLDFSSNISSLYGMFYNEGNGLFYAAGYDKKGIDIMLASADGVNWENINVPEFGNVFSTPNSYCAIQNDPNYPANIRTIYCWGNNSYNQLAWGQATSVLTLAKPVLQKDNLKTLSYGLSSFAPIIGPLNAFIPSEIANPQGVTTPMEYTLLAGGDSHYCGLRIDKKSIDCWGAGASGQLADGVVHPSGYSTPVPTPVNLPTEITTPIQRIVAGGDHTCILDSSGKPWCAGDNSFGQVDATESLQKSFPGLVIANHSVPNQYKYIGIAAGDDFTCGVTIDSKVYCWGQDYSFVGKPLTQITSQSADFSGFTEGNITAAGGTTCVLSSTVHSGKTNAWCWGLNDHGQIGNGNSGGFTSDPQMVTSTESPITFTTLAQSRIATCGLDSNGYAYCWGDNTYAEAGGGSASESPIVNPQGPIMLNGKAGQFKQISMGVGSICFVGVDTNTYCLGNNSQGQLGVGSTPSIVLQLTLVNLVTQTESATPGLPSKIK